MRRRSRRAHRDRAARSRIGCRSCTIASAKSWISCGYPCIQSSSGDGCDQPPCVSIFSLRYASASTSASGAYARTAEFGLRFASTSGVRRVHRDAVAHAAERRVGADDLGNGAVVERAHENAEVLDVLVAGADRRRAPRSKRRRLRQRSCLGDHRRRLRALASLEEQRGAERMTALCRATRRRPQSPSACWARSAFRCAIPRPGYAGSRRPRRRAARRPSRTAARTPSSRRNSTRGLRRRPPRRSRRPARLARSSIDCGVELGASARSNR